MNLLNEEQKTQNPQNHRVENKKNTWSADIWDYYDLWINTKQVYSRWWNSYELIIAYLYAYRNFNTTKNGQISFTAVVTFTFKAETLFGVSFRWTFEGIPTLNHL